MSVSVENWDDFRTVESLDDLFITDDKADWLMRRAKEVIGRIMAESSDEGLKAALGRAKFIYDLPKGEQQAAIDETGTAMFPVFHGKYVVIGGMGSVWLDTSINGNACRIAINPYSEASDPLDKVFSVQRGDDI